MNIVMAFDGTEMNVVNGTSVLTYTSPTLNSVLVIGDGIETSYGLIRKASRIDSIVDEDEVPFRGKWELSKHGYFILFDRAIPNSSRVIVYFRPATE
jgi:hypothetical protein